MKITSRRHAVKKCQHELHVLLFRNEIVENHDSFFDSASHTTTTKIEAVRIKMPHVEPRWLIPAFILTPVLAKSRISTMEKRGET